MKINAIYGVEYHNFCHGTYDFLGWYYLIELILQKWIVVSQRMVHSQV